MEAQKKSSAKKYVLIAIIGALTVGFSWYFLIYKPKADALKKTADAKAAALAAGKTPSTGTNRKVTVGTTAASHPANTNVGLGTGGSTSFDPTSYTDAISLDLYPSSTFAVRSSDPYLSAMQLSDDQLVDVYYDWIDRYFPTYGVNLVDAMNNASTVWNIEWAQNTQALADRLNGL